MRGLFKKWDVCILAAVLLLAAGLFWTGRGGDSDRLLALVRCDGEVVLEIPLHTITEPQTRTLDSGIVIELSSDGARILSSPCRDKTCVHCGKLTASGETAVCLPCRTQLVLTGGGENGLPDAMAY